MTKTFTLAVWLTSIPAFAQLYVVTGSPTPKYNQAFASALFEVGPTGVITSVRELVPKETQTQWMTISYDARVLLIRSNPSVMALSLDSAPAAKSCPQPRTPSGFRALSTNG